MNKKELIEVIEGYLDPILAELHYELVDVEYVKEGPNYYLRIYIDKGKIQESGNKKALLRSLILPSSAFLVFCFL